MPIITAMFRPKFYQIKDLQATAGESGTEITLIFTEPPEADSYEYRLDGGSPRPCTGSGHIVADLTPETTYRVEVRGLTGRQYSPWSNFVDVTTLPAPTVPDQITDLSASFASDTEIDLTFTPAVGAFSHEYRISLDGEDWSEPAALMSNRLSGLEPETEYFVQVRGVNTVGAGAWSNTASATTAATPETVPEQITDLTAEAASDTEIDLTFTPAVGAFSHEYRISLDGEDWSEPAALTSNRLSGLEPETEYFVQVRGVNTVGAGAWSNTANAVTEATPDTTAPILTGASGTATGGTTATLTVSTNEGNGTLYAVVTTSATPPSKAQVKAGQNHLGGAAAYASNQAVTSTGTKSFSATGLTSETTYYTYFMHEDAVGNQSNVAAADGFTTFDVTAPILTGASGTATSDTTATLTVSTNEGNGTLYAVVTTSSTPPSKAQVKAGQNHLGGAAAYASNQAITSTGTKSFSATGLSAGTTYYTYFMHEDAATNQSDVAAASSFLTDAEPDTTAPVLSSPTGTATGGTTATLTVSTNEGNGTLYVVVTTSSTPPSKAQVKAGQNHLGGAAAYASNQAVTSTGTKSFSATGLSAGTTYYTYFMHEDAATNQSDVAAASSFLTLGPVQPIAAGATTGTSIAFGSHQAGDIIFVSAYRAGSTTPPSLPSGWTSVQSGGANGISVRVGYKIAASGSETSGTWTNATRIAYAIYRKANIGNSAMSDGKDTLISWPAISPLQVTDGSSWVVGFAVNDKTLPDLPSGMTSRANDTRQRVADSGGGVTSWDAHTAGPSTDVWRVVTVELKAA